MCHLRCDGVIPWAQTCHSTNPGDMAFLSSITNIPQRGHSVHVPLTREQGMKEGLTEFSFSCSPSPLGSEDRLLAEFLFGVEVMAPAFFFTVSTSQLAWSSLCVLFPALITLEEKPEKPVRQSDVWRAESPVPQVSPDRLHNWHKTNALLNAQDLTGLVE